MVKKLRISAELAAKQEDGRKVEFPPQQARMIKFGVTTAIFMVYAPLRILKKRI